MVSGVWWDREQEAGDRRQDRATGQDRTGVRTNPRRGRHKAHDGIGQDGAVDRIGGR